MMPVDTSLMAAIMAGAATAGALLMRFGGRIFRTQDECNREDWCEQVLQELIHIRHSMERGTEESIEMRKVIHTNTRVMDNLREAVVGLQIQQGEMKGMIK